LSDGYVWTAIPTFVAKKASEHDGGALLRNTPSETHCTSTSVSALDGCFSLSVSVGAASHAS